MKYQKLYEKLHLIDEAGIAKKLAAGALATGLTISGASCKKGDKDCIQTKTPNQKIQTIEAPKEEPKKKAVQQTYNWLGEYILKLKEWEGIDKSPRHDRTGFAIGHGTHYSSWMDPILKAYGTNWEQLKTGRATVDEKLAGVLLRIMVAKKVKELEARYPEYEEMHPTVQKWLLDASYRYGVNAMPNFRKLVRKDHTDLKTLWKEFRNNDTIRADLKKDDGPAKDRAKTYAQWYKEATARKDNKDE